MSMVDAPGAGLFPAAARALLTGLTGDLGACSKRACVNIMYMDLQKLHLCLILLHDMQEHLSRAMTVLASPPV